MQIVQRRQRTKSHWRLAVPNGEKTPLAALVDLDKGLLRLVNAIEDQWGLVWLEDVDVSRLGELFNVGAVLQKAFHVAVARLGESTEELNTPLAIPGLTKCAKTGEMHERSMLEAMVRTKAGELRLKTEEDGSASMVHVCRYCEALCPSTVLSGSGPPPLRPPKTVPPVRIGRGQSAI
jgi:hypothetical protein